MKMNRLLICILCIVVSFVSSCDYVVRERIMAQFEMYDGERLSLGVNDVSYEDTSDVIKIPPIEVDHTYEAILEDVIDSIYVVPLETTEESFLAVISKVKIYNDIIYVLDGKSNVIKSFAKDGSFIGQIGKVGQGPGEYNSPMDFFVDDRGIVVFDNAQCKLLIYDKNLRYVEDKRLPFLCQQVERLSGGDYLFYMTTSQNYHIPKILGYNLLVTDSLFNIKRRGVYRDEQEWISFFTYNSVVRSCDALFINDTYTDSIYTVSSSGEMSCAYVLDYDGHRPIEVYKERGLLKKKRYDKDYYYLFSTFVSDEHVLVNTGPLDKTVNVVYSKRCKKSVVVEDVTFGGKSLVFKMCNPIGVWRDYFVFVNYADEILSNKSLGCVMYGMDDNLLTLTSEDNPVLVMVRFANFNNDRI